MGCASEEPPSCLSVQSSLLGNLHQTCQSPTSGYPPPRVVPGPHHFWVARTPSTDTSPSLPWVASHPVLCLNPPTLGNVNPIFKLQALVCDSLPLTAAVFSYVIPPRKLSANEQVFFFVGAQTVVSLMLQTTQIISDICFMLPCCLRQLK